MFQVMVESRPPSCGYTKAIPLRSTHLQAACEQRKTSTIGVAVDKKRGTDIKIQIRRQWRGRLLPYLPWYDMKRNRLLKVTYKLCFTVSACTILRELTAYSKKMLRPSSEPLSGTVARTLALRTVENTEISFPCMR